MLNAHRGIPDRDRASCTRRRSSGPGMRRSPTLSYVPARLSLVPTLFATTTAAGRRAASPRPRSDGRVSLGTEVNVLPAAIEACRAPRRSGRRAGQPRRCPGRTATRLLDPTAVDSRLEVDEPPRPAVAGRAGRRGPARSASWWRRGSATAPPCSWASGWCPTPPCPAWRATRARGVDRDVLRRRARPGRGRRAGPGRAARRRRSCSASPELYTWLRPQPAGADAAHRDDERPGPDRGATAP